MDLDLVLQPLPGSSRSFDARQFIRERFVSNQVANRFSSEPCEWSYIADI
jgi:hypothetical protein